MEKGKTFLSKRLEVLLIACVTLAITISVVVGATYALFSTQNQFSNVLQAGKLEVTLERTSLQATTLDDDGILTEMPINNELVDFTNTTANVFDLDTNDTIVPGCKYSATMKLTNNGTVACDYNVSVQWLTDAEDYSDEFAKQLKMSVVDENGNDAITGSIMVGESIEFTISVEFVDDRTDSTIINNNVMGKKVSFNLLVSAVQKIA